MTPETTAVTEQTPAPPIAAPLPGAGAALALLLAINLFNYIDRQVLAAVEPNIRKELLPNDPDEVAMTKTGMLGSAFLITYIIIAPLFGWLGDRIRRWLLVGIGVILWSLASGASGLAGVLSAYEISTVWQIGAHSVSVAFIFLFLTRCLVGVGEGAYGPVAPTMIADLYPVKHRGSKLAWFYLAFPVGSCLGYALGGWMASMQGQVLSFGDLTVPLGWRWAFYVAVPPGLLLGLLCFFMREPPRGRADAARMKRARLADYLILLRIPSYVLNCLGMTGMTFALGGLAFWIPGYLEDRKGLGQDTTLLGIDGTTVFGGITVLAGLTATLLGGLAGDRLQPRFPGAYFLVSGIAMIIAFPFVLLVIVSPFPLAWLWLFIAAFCLFFNTGPSNTALANVTHPSIRGTAFAVNILFIHAFGDVISPPIVGYLSGKYGFNAGFRAISASVLVGGLFWLLASRYLARDTELAPLRVPGEP